MKDGMSRNKYRMSMKIQGIALGSNFVLFLDKVDTYAKQPKTLR
jgi:hypothetical protein